MKTTKKILAVVMACIMLIGILPISTFAASTKTVWVAGTDVGGAETTYWLNDGNGGITSVGASESNYNVKYEPSVDYGIGLTLKGANLSKYNKPDPNHSAEYGIYTREKLTLTLVGENSIKIEIVSASQSRDVYGLFVGNWLIVKGDGSLNVSVPKAGDLGTATAVYTTELQAKETATLVAEARDRGVAGGYNLKIYDSATVIAKGAYGIENATSIEIYGGTLEAIGTSVAIRKGYIKTPDYDAKIKVNEKAQAKGARNMKDGEYIYNFKYVKVSPYPPIIAAIRSALNAVKTFILEDIIGAFIAWIILLLIK